MDASKKRQLQFLLETVFQALFFLYVILGFNSLTSGTRIVSLFLWPTYFFGAALLLWRIFDIKHYIRMPGIWLLVIMCAVCAASIVLNRQYNLKKNVIYLAMWVFYFFMLFLRRDTDTGEMVRRQFDLAAHIVCFSAFILAGISLYMMFSGF